jgi:hypothetical protein
MCLPVRSILPWRLSFFEERGRSRSPEMHREAGRFACAFLRAYSELWRFPASGPFSLQQPVTQAVSPLQSEATLDIDSIPKEKSHV